MASFVQSDMKEKNRATAYALLKGRQTLSKADIARESGISATTVMKIIDYFQTLGIAGETEQKAEAEEGSFSLGRRPQLLFFNPRAAYALGAEYDGVHLGVGVVDLAGQLHSLVRRKAPQDISSLFSDTLGTTIDAALAEAGLGRDSVVGLGMGVPGTVDSDGRTLRFAPLVGMGRAFDAGPYLEGLTTRLGVPCFLENDANAAAVGEFAARGLGPKDDLLFAVLGRGLGAGLILEGAIRKGPRAFAGEIGYLVSEVGWRASLEAPGWLEAKTDLPSFWEEVASSSGPSQATLERVADYISVGLANICVALDLERVVLGLANRGGFGRDLLALVGERLSRLSVLDVACEAPRAPEPGVSGAGAMALDRWLSGVFAG